MGDYDDRAEEEVREDTPTRETDDDRWQMGDPPEEGREGEEQDSGFHERGGQAG
jgi:hypothetical protein